MQIDAKTVFCDDIRREDSGKAILIGVYMDDLVPSKLPIQFPLSVWVKAKGIDAGKHPFTLRIIFPGEDKKLEMKGEIEVNEPSEPASLVMSGFPADVSQTGFIRVEFEVNGEVFDAGELRVKEPPSGQAEVATVSN